MPDEHPPYGEPDPLAEPRALAPIHLNHDFRVLWVARTLGQTAANTAQFGSLIIVVEQSDSALLASLLVICWVLPGALLGPLSGVVVDSFPKPTLLAIANATRATACLTLVALGAGLGGVYAVVLAIAAMGPFIGPAESALVPTLVRREALTSANALLNLLRYVAQVLGLAILAPLLTRTASVEVLWVVTGSLFAAAAAYAVFVPHREGEPEPIFPDEFARPRRGRLREAAEYMREHREVRAAVIQLSLLAATLPLLTAMMPVYMRDVLTQRVSEAPVVLLPAVVGMLAGLRLVSGFVHQRGAPWLSAAGLLVFAAGLVVLALIDAWAEGLSLALRLDRLDLGVIELSTRAQIAMLIVLPMGFAFSLINVATNAVLNEAVPRPLQGRIFALQMMIASLAALPPLLLGGALTEVADVRVVLGGIPLLIAFAWAWAHWGPPDPGAWRGLRWSHPTGHA